MYVRNCWYVAAWDHEHISDDGLVSRTILNEPALLYRASDGCIVGLEDRCRHRFAPLSKGRREGDDVRCMYHGLRFDRRGVCNDIPGQDMIPATARVKTYPVVSRHSWVWVWMGDADAADEDLIPPAVGLDHPEWTLRSGHMDYKANYLLINDNLTDFSHLSYVHANSFGASEEFARTRPTITRLERGIRVERWVVDGARRAMTQLQIARGQGDRWQTYDYLAPGVLLMRSANFPVGSAGRYGGKAPTDWSEAMPGSDNFTSQAVTPMTDKTTRYYFSWGPRCAEGSVQMAEAMAKLAVMAFTEDREMIEAQQAVIDLDPNRTPLLTSADVGPMQMRAVIDRLAKREAGAPAASAA